MTTVLISLDTRLSLTSYILLPYHLERRSFIEPVTRSKVLILFQRKLNMGPAEISLRVKKWPSLTWNWRMPQKDIWVEREKTWTNFTLKWQYNLSRAKLRDRKLYHKKRSIYENAIWRAMGHNQQCTIRQQGHQRTWKILSNGNDSRLMSMLTM